MRGGAGARRDRSARAAGGGEKGLTLDYAGTPLGLGMAELGAGDEDPGPGLTEPHQSSSFCLPVGLS